jgi:hypothetical protein
MKRTSLVLAATVVAALTLTLVGGIGAAQATNSTDATSVFTALNKARVSHKVPTMQFNGLMSDYMQANAAVYAAHGEAFAKSVFSSAGIPGGCTDYDWGYEHATGSTAKARIASQIASHDSTALSADYRFGGVGYYVKGSSAYAVYVLAKCATTPEGKITVGAITFIGTPVVGKAFTAKAPVSLDYSGTMETTLNEQFSWTEKLASGAEKTFLTFLPTFTPKAEDVGATYKLDVTATAAGYATASRESAASAAVKPGTLSSPKSVVITGFRNVGQPLSISPTGWSTGGTSPSFDIQWFSDGHAIPGAILGIYKQVAFDHGHKITVRVIAHLPGYTTVQKTSTTSTKTGYPFLTLTDPIGIDGTHTYNSTVSASVGSWAPATSALTYTYQWYEGGKKVAGATKATHKIGVVGAETNRVSVAVTAHESHFAPTTAISPDYRVFKLDFKETTRPTISLPTVVGVGSVLKAKSGAWSPTPTKVAYQWTRNGVVIPGAVGSSYTLVAADLGTTLRLDEFVQKAGYDDASDSASTFVLPPHV